MVHAHFNLMPVAGGLLVYTTVTYVLSNSSAINLHRRAALACLAARTPSPTRLLALHACTYHLPTTTAASCPTTACSLAI